MYPPTSTAAFTAELVNLDGTHISVPANTTSTINTVNFSGCYLNLLSGLQECLYPWTVYQVTIRTLTSHLVGHATSLQFTTPPMVYTRAPTNLTAASIASTSASLQLFMPLFPTAPITGFYVSGIDSRGKSYSTLCPVSRTAENQALYPMLPFSIVVPNLAAFTEYNLTIAAVTDYGKGPDSTSVCDFGDEGELVVGMSL